MMAFPGLHLMALFLACGSPGADKQTTCKVRGALTFFQQPRLDTSLLHVTAADTCAVTMVSWILRLGWPDPIFHCILTRNSEPYSFY